MSPERFGIRSAPYIAFSKTQGGIFETLGVLLQGLVSLKNLAIKEGRYEEAARHREKEVEMILRIEEYMKEYGLKLDEHGVKP